MDNDPMVGVRLDNFRLAQRLQLRLLALDADNGTLIAPVFVRHSPKNSVQAGDSGASPLSRCCHRG
jgi:hypothetical protein